MRFRVTHRNEYHYESPVTSSYGEARLVPRDLPHQTCGPTPGLEIVPAPVDLAQRTDFFGNYATYFAVDQPHTQLTVTGVHEVEVIAGPPQLDLSGTGSWEEARDLLRASADPAGLDARQFVIDSPLVRRSPELASFALVSFTPGRPLVEAATDLSHRIFTEFTYRPGSTSISTSVDEILATRTGVCQDFAHFGIGCLRSIGLPARYVSGYLETDPPPGLPRLMGADASHAWFAVHLAGSGWLDLDPTNDMVPSGRHITATWGRDYADVTPLKGVVYTPGQHHDLVVSVDVERL